MNNTANKVTIRRDFTIQVPHGMVYTTDKAETGDGNILIMVEEGTAFKDAPSAARGLTLAAPQEVGVEELDLKTADAKENISKAVTDLIVKLMGAGTICRCLKSDDDVMVFCGGKVYDTVPSVRFVIVTPAAIYNGQIWTRSAQTAEEQKKLVNDILSGVESYNPTGTGEFEVTGFKAPDLGTANRAQIDVFTVPMPEGMTTLNDVGEDAASLRRTFAFLAVPGDYAGGLAEYKFAPAAILAQHGEEIRGWQKNAPVADKYQLMAQVVELLNDSLRKAGREELEQITRTEDFLVGFAEGAEERRSKTARIGYSWFVFYDGTLWQGVVYLNYSGDKAAVREEVHRWLCGVKPAAYWEIQAYEDALRRKVLGEYLGQDGKMDAIKAVQLFSRDVVSNGAEDIVLEDDKYIMSALQFNNSALTRYPRIRDNTGVFSREIMRVANFVELNQSLRLPAKYIHRKLREELCEREFTGMAAFFLCAWHMIDVEELGENEYMVYLDQNLVRAIPECYAYAGELFRTLRAFNGKRGEFRLVIATEFNLASPVDEIESPVPGADDWETGKILTVPESEHPYKGVAARVDAARNSEPHKDNAEWRMKVLEDGTLGVLSYSGVETDLTIPESYDGCAVTQICDEAFSPAREGISYAGKTACLNLRRVTVPGSVLKVGNRAFAECHALVSVGVSDGVQVVGDMAFANCTALEEVSMPNNRIATGRDLFSGCTALKGPVAVNDQTDAPDEADDGDEDLSELMKLLGLGDN